MPAQPMEIRCLKDDLKWQTWPAVIFPKEQTIAKTSQRQGESSLSEKELH